MNLEQLVNVHISTGILTTIERAILVRKSIKVRQFVDGIKNSQFFLEFFFDEIFFYLPNIFESMPIP